jgi:hypothetical protein
MTAPLHTLASKPVLIEAVEQRARLHKERKAPPTGPKEIKHGTPGGARTHRKRGEEPCDRCTAAAKASNARYQQRKTAKRRMERATA